MPQVIRQSAFETNSSSTHSIVIATGSFIPDILRANERGQVEIFPGEFGWEVENYNDAATKASYCLTWLLQSGGYNEEIEQITIRNLSAFTQDNQLRYNLERFINLIAQETGHQVILHRSEWSYIDHQSHDVCEEAFASDESLRNFIFNSASILYTDNDNHY